MAARQALGELDLQPYMYSMYRLFKTTMLRNNMLRHTYHKEQPGPLLQEVISCESVQLYLLGDVLVAKC